MLHFAVFARMVFLFPFLTAVYSYGLVIQAAISVFQIDGSSGTLAFNVGNNLGWENWVVVGKLRHNTAAKFLSVSLGNLHLKRCALVP